MTRPTDHERHPGRRVAVFALLAHLIANAVHGIPHLAIPIEVGAWFDAVVAVVVFVLPIVGVGLLWRGRATVGAATFTVAIAGSLLTGLVFHFAVVNPDNVAVVVDPTFEATAVGVAVVDALSLVAAAWVWRTVQLANRADVDGGSTGLVDGVPPHETGPVARFLYRAAAAELGQVPDPLAVLAHHRALIAGNGAMEVALQRADTVDDHLTELAMLKAATAVECEYCLDIGAAIGRDHGITEAQLRTLREFEDSDAFDETERLVLRYAAALTETPVAVPGELRADLQGRFDDPQLVELTAAIAFENYRARFNRGLGIEAQGFSEDASRPVPASESGDTEQSRTGGAPSA